MGDREWLRGLAWTDLPSGAIEALEAATVDVTTVTALRAFIEACRTDPTSPHPPFAAETTAGGLSFVRALLAASERCAADLGRRGVPEVVIRHTWSDLGLWMVKTRETTGRWGLKNPSWLARHWAGKLLRLGRLQFEFTLWDGPQVAGGPAPREPVLSVHVPEGSPLDQEEVLASFARGARDLPVWYPEVGPRFFTCRSWLLDPELGRILPPDSRIVQFQRTFRLLEVEGDDRQLRERVFGAADVDLNQFVPVTSLQKTVQSRWKNGGVFRGGAGFRPLG